MVNLLNQAANLMSEIYLRQAFAANPEVRAEIASSTLPNRAAAAREVRRLLRPVGPDRRRQAVRRQRAAARRRGLLPGRPDQGDVRRLSRRQPGAGRGADQPLHRGQARRATASSRCLIRSNTSSGSSPPRACSSRRRAITSNASLKRFLTLARAVLPHRRLFPVGAGVDGPEGHADRGRDRAVRGLHRPPLRPEDRVRGVRHARATRRRARRSTSTRASFARWKPICRSRSATRTSSAASNRRWSSPTRCTAAATTCRASRPSPSTCPTTSGCARPRAPRR